MSIRSAQAHVAWPAWPACVARLLNPRAACAGHASHATRACICTVPPAIGTLAAQQAKPTMATLKGLTQLLNCAATHPDAEVRFRARGPAHRQRRLPPPRAQGALTGSWPLLPQLTPQQAAGNIEAAN
jgi:hypothetical protein